MKKLNLKTVIISGTIAYALGVAAFLGSFLVPFMSDPELQANLILAVAIIPASIIGASFYYRKGHKGKGLFLGIGMFLMTMVLDAVITVPLFVIPAGGNHISFFTEPGFWMVALEYVLAVTLYAKARAYFEGKKGPKVLYMSSKAASK